MSTVARQIDITFAGLHEHLFNTCINFLFFMVLSTLFDVD